MRPVMIYEEQKATSDKGSVVYVKTEKGEAKFHEFGVKYEEFENGAGNYSVAIIEWPTGQVDTVPAHMIRFLDVQL